MNKSKANRSYYLKNKQKCVRINFLLENSEAEKLKEAKGNKSYAEFFRGIVAEGNSGKSFQQVTITKENIATFLKTILQSDHVNSDDVELIVALSEKYSIQIE